MFASEFGIKTDGDGKYWIGPGSGPAKYTVGPFDTDVEAEDEARHYLEEYGEDAVTVGIGEEIEIRVPDAEDVIDTIFDGVYEQCGEAADDYLAKVTDLQKLVLNARLQMTIGEWLTEYNLWPTFVRITEYFELPGDEDN